MTKLNIASLKILAVDDHVTIQHYIEQHLKTMGFVHIDKASNVEEATKKMEAAAYNIIFLDWHMPGKSGYNLLQKCREDRNYDNTAFIIVSAESADRAIIEAVKAGATSYIVKPLQESTLTEHVNKTLAWLERRAEKAS